MGENMYEGRIVGVVRCGEGGRRGDGDFREGEGVDSSEGDGREGGGDGVGTTGGWDRG